MNHDIIRGEFSLIPRLFFLITLQTFKVIRKKKRPGDEARGSCAQGQLQILYHNNYFTEQRRGLCLFLSLFGGAIKLARIFEGTTRTHYTSIKKQQMHGSKYYYIRIKDRRNNNLTIQTCCFKATKFTLQKINHSSAHL